MAEAGIARTDGTIQGGIVERQPKVVVTDHSRRPLEKTRQIAHLVKCRWTIAKPGNPAKVSAWMTLSAPGRNSPTRRPDSASAVTTDRALTQRILDAVDAAGRTGATAIRAIDRRVLDVACGPGIMTVELASIAGEVVAFDVTPEMLIRARERCARAGVRNVTFEEGSASDLPFPDDCFERRPDAAVDPPFPRAPPGP